MNAYIDSLLTYKNNEYNDYNKDKNEKIDKTDTQKYLESCIVFIYDNENKNIIPFIKEIEKFKSKNEKEGEGNNKISEIKIDKAFDELKKSSSLVKDFIQSLILFSEAMASARSIKSGS